MIKLMEPVDTNTSIEWWNRNRARLNDVISSFNDWQTVYRFDEWKSEVLKAEIDLCRRYGEENHFSDWQFEILDDMETFIETVEAG